MDLTARFVGSIKKEQLFNPEDQLLLAVSGGLDSVVLCELCSRAGYNFRILHCNFQLRGEESERDEDHVRQLAEAYGVQIWVKEFDTENSALRLKKGIQETARILRYEWFAEVLQQLRTEENNQRIYVATAHHLNDNIETVLMNFFKGSGIAGLRGILPRQEQLVRPLLFARREELLAFANENRLRWVEDSSNESDKYARNYFRHQLMPVVRNVYPEAEDNLSDNIQRFRDIEILYHQAIAVHKKSLIETKGNELHIPVLKLTKSQPLRSIVYEITKDFGFSAQQVDEVIALLDSNTGKYVQSATHRVIRNRAWLIIAATKTEEGQTILIEEKDTKVRFPAGVLELKIGAVQEDSLLLSADIAQLSVKDIIFPLLLRRWKTGDYFYPLGMKKKKKVARFLIDLKMSKTEKEKVWVLEMNKKIIWVVGHRIDDRLKISANEKEALIITVQRGSAV
jgi:tRNA(Ile)-lysidine synthase